MCEDNTQDSERREAKVRRLLREAAELVSIEVNDRHAEGTGPIEGLHLCESHVRQALEHARYVGMRPGGGGGR